MSTLAAQPPLVGREGLLDQVDSMVRQGVRVVFVHGLAGVGKSRFLEALADAHPTARLVDGLLNAGPIEILRRKVRAGGLWFLASRARPAPRWAGDLPPGAFVSLELCGLNDRDVEDLLELRGAGSVDPEARRQSRGHPLCLLSMLEHGGQPLERSPGAAVQMLRGIGAVPPTPILRDALWVCALARTTDESLLREVLEQASSTAIFDGLQAFAFVRAVPGGLRMDPLAREIVLAEGRWRDAVRVRLLRARLARAVADRVARDPSAIDALLHLLEDRNGITAGPPLGEAAQVLERHQLATDVLGSVVLEMVDELGLRANHRVLFVKRWQGTDASFRSLLLRAASHPDLGALVFAGTGPARPGDRQVGGAVLRVHDTRVVGLAPWLLRQVLPEPTQTLSVLLLEQEPFEDAVREALRALARPDGELSGLRFGRTAVGIRALGLAEAEQHESLLRGLLRTHIEDLADPRARRAVQRTYAQGAPKQFTVASELGLSFATYRRSLAKGTQALVAALWASENAGAVV